MSNQNEFSSEISEIFWNAIPIDYFPRFAPYQKLHAMATVLERFCARAPDAVTLNQLAKDIDLPRRTVRKLCSSLGSIGIIVATEAVEKWSLSIHPSEVTLDDVWRAVLFLQTSSNATVFTRKGRDSADDIGVLLSQAILAVNQSISTHLKKFQLDKVRISQFGFWSMR